MKIKMNVDIRNGNEIQAAIEEAQARAEEINRKICDLYDLLRGIQPLYIEIAENEHTPPTK